LTGSGPRALWWHRHWSEEADLER